MYYSYYEVINLNRRRFIVGLILWILSFFFGYRIKESDEKIDVLSTRLTQRAKAKFSPNSIGVFATAIREADLPSIKNLGCNYILWVCYETNTTVIQNTIDFCSQYGLNVLLSVSQRFQVNDDTTAINIINATKSKSNLIGYYVLDEPDLNNISITRQNQVQGIVAELTSLPIFISTTISSSDVRISNKFDYYFIDSYFTGKNYNDIQVGNTTIYNISASRMLSVAGYVGIEKCIPCVGFFTDNSRFTVTDQNFIFNANCKTLELYRNKGFIMFMWGDSSVGGKDLHSDKNFYNNALRFSKFSGMVPRSG